MSDFKEDARRRKLRMAEAESGPRKRKTIEGKRRRSVVLYRSEEERQDLERAVAATEKGDRKGRVCNPAE